MKAQSRLQKIRVQRRIKRLKFWFLVLAALSTWYIAERLNLSPVQSASAPTFEVVEVEKTIEVTKEVPVDYTFETDKARIQAMILAAFPEDGLRAQAVAKAESGFDPNKENFGRAGSIPSLPNYKGECSVGLFQINLAQDGCQGEWVHAKNIPGKTIEEKIAWLKVPENNIKYAKEHLYEAQGWKPWSAYTNGSYRNF